MKNKREARVAYYEGIRRATLDHFRVTEEGLRKLAGVSQSQTEKLVADLQKQHDKLLKRIDRRIKEETKS